MKRPAFAGTAGVVIVLLALLALAAGSASATSSKHGVQGGTLNIDSLPGEGTTVYARIPFSGPKEIRA